jgi:transposase
VDLTDEQWAVLEPLLPRRQRPRRTRRGRPWRDARAVLDGILWILRTGAPWADLPERYPPYQTCHRRFQPTQDGRPLRRYRRRWIVERLMAWLQNYRRLVTRYEYHAANFLGFVQLGCVMILLRAFMR